MPSAKNDNLTRRQSVIIAVATQLQIPTEDVLPELELSIHAPHHIVRTLCHELGVTFNVTPTMTVGELVRQVEAV